MQYVFLTQSCEQKRVNEVVCPCEKGLQYFQCHKMVMLVLGTWHSAKIKCRCTCQVAHWMILRFEASLDYGQRRCTEKSTKTSLCKLLNCGFVLTWSLHKRDWREDRETWRVREKRSTAVMLLSYCRLQTVCSFAQATVTIEICILKGRTVVQWFLLLHIFTRFALRKSL